MKQSFALALILSALAVTSCSDTEDNQAITISVIGGPPRLVAPRGARLDPGAAMITGATAQGLVSFDAAGRVEPALAERWIVTDNGLSLIFRIRRTNWSDGRPVMAVDVARSLTRLMSTNQRNSRIFRGVERITAMTGQVIEFRLSSPQPTLLQLLAQPEMAVFHDRITNGTGPYRIHSIRAGVTRLRPAPSGEGDEMPQGDERSDIRMRGEPAPLAVARFVAQGSAFVTGGTFNDLPYARAARVNPTDFRLDPAYGLFGLAVMADQKALQSVDVRRALAMVIDREQLVQRFGVNSWRAINAVLPAQFAARQPRSVFDWAQLSLADRRLRARAIVANRAPLPVMRIALPQGLGARLLFASIAADFATIGVKARAVPLRAAADLRLIDEVAPQSSALWYFDRLSCARGISCSIATEMAAKAAATAPTLDARAIAVSEADAAYSLHQGFIPLALPLRWSLVSPNLAMLQPSGFALHPLGQLRPPRR